MTKGIKTSELWVVLILIGEQIMTTLNADLSGLSDVQLQVAELAKQIQAQAGTGEPSAMWIALAYVIGRQLLKWREVGKG